MYDAAYAKAWIADYESGKDVLRSRFIVPYLARFIEEAPRKSEILDIGCGWGIAIPHLKKDQNYTGLDMTTEFFEYIKNTQDTSNVELRYGGFPGPFNFSDNSFDLIIASMSLHTVGDLESSVENLFLKLKKSGKIAIVDFNDEAEGPVVERVKPTVKRERYYKGLFTLDCGLEVETETFFHREEDYENEIMKHGQFKKEKLGPVFVGYECFK